MKSLEASSDWLGVVPFRKCRGSLLFLVPSLNFLMDGVVVSFYFSLYFYFLSEICPTDHGESDRLIYNQSLIL